MHNILPVLNLLIFITIVVLLVWRPKGMNEAIPPAIGATILISIGIVSLTDIHYIFKLK